MLLLGYYQPRARRDDGVLKLDIRIEHSGTQAYPGGYLSLHMEELLNTVVILGLLHITHGNILVICTVGQLHNNDALAHVPRRPRGGRLSAEITSLQTN